ncbi:MAG: hypothetical protein EAZ18_20550 [Oscillatoriales cyanobacterium]|nr:MAG: hypothetical protein EAZ18_20550 [Oscillatoriales cyanobacterium]
MTRPLKGIAATDSNICGNLIPMSGRSNRTCTVKPEFGDRTLICCSNFTIVLVAAIELTARLAKIKLCFRGLRGFGFMAFIENNTQKLVATWIISPTCQLASFI